MDDDYEIEEPQVGDPRMFMMPMSFGKQTKKNDINASFAQTKRVEERKPAASVQPVNEDEDEDDDDDEDDESDDSDEMIGPMPAEAESQVEDENEEDNDDFPVSHELVLKDHTKAVSALTLDPSGSRLVSGSYDHDLKFWDFAGMGADRKPFKTVEPVEGHRIHHAEYSHSGDSLLVITSSLKPKLYSREGAELSEFVNGDMYIRDMRYTKGHVSEVTSVMWHPHDRDTFITGSADSTVRIWNVHNKWEHKSVLIVRPKGTAQRMKVTACAYSPDGKWIGAASTDGVISIWGTSGPMSRPSAVADAHVRQTETSGIVFSHDGVQLVTRGGDNTVKLWDVRRLKTPLKELKNIENNHTETNIMYAPNGQYILTGQSCHPDDTGYLLVLDSKTLTPVRNIPIGTSSVIRVLWNTRINQIVTGSYNGTIHVLYSPISSLRGAKLVLTRTPKARHVDDDPNFTMDLPEGYSGDQAARLEDGEGERLMRKLKTAAKGNIKATRPEMPTSAFASDPDKDHVRQQYGLSTMRTEDPREALLKFADEAEKDPIFTKAYLKNQPKTLLEERAGDDVEEPPAKRRK